MPNVPESLFTCLTEDLREADKGPHDSHRFGLTWKLNAEGEIHRLEFRADVLLDLPADTPPIIVLDGYANSGVRQYERLFPKHEVKYLEEWTAAPLDVEVLDPAFNPPRNPEQVRSGIIDRRNFRTDDQVKWRNAWMSEIGQMTQNHEAGTLNLTYADEAEQLAQASLQPLWSAKVHPPLQADAIKTLWWFAGRGINTFEGRHVVAWHAPHRPKSYEHHLLAALAPTSAPARAALKTHYFQAELLQMLHRGRQTRYPEGDPKRPRVLLLFEPGELPKSGLSGVRSCPVSSSRRARKTPYTPQPSGRSPVNC